jgi:hypothetical protein
VLSLLVIQVHLVNLSQPRVKAQLRYLFLKVLLARHDLLIPTQSYLVEKMALKNI